MRKVAATVARLVNHSVRRTVLVAAVVINIVGGGESSPVSPMPQAKRTKFGLGSFPNLHFLREQQVRRKDHDGAHLPPSWQESSDYEHQVAEYHRRQYLHHLEQYERRLSPPQAQHARSSTLDRRMPEAASASSSVLPVIPTFNERLLNCSSFPCLLARFDMVKTDRGYILNPDASNRDLIQDSPPAACDDGFRRWISKFRIGRKGYGFELVLKELQSGLLTSWSSSSSLPTASSSHLPSSSGHLPFPGGHDVGHRFKELRPEEVFSFGRLDKGSSSSRDLGHLGDAGRLGDFGHTEDAGHLEDPGINGDLGSHDGSGDDKASTAQDDDFYDYFGLIDGGEKKRGDTSSEGEQKVTK